MKQLTKLFYAVLLSILFTTACNDDEPQPTLPPATQEGLNTFGCFINGELLVPKDGVGDFGGRGAEKIYIAFGSDINQPQSDFMEITAGNRRDDSGDLVTLFISVLNEDTFTVSQACNNDGSVPGPCALNYAYTLTRSKNGVRTDYYSFDNSGFVTITKLDHKNTIVAGVFEFKAYNKNNPSDTIEIVEGRFDINWSTLYEE